MFKTIEGAADSEIRSVIRFLNSRNVLPSEIHYQIRQVYGDNAMSDGMVRKWVPMFNEGRENVHDEARSGRPSLVNDDLLRKVNESERDDSRFTISDLLELLRDKMCRTPQTEFHTNVSNLESSSRNSFTHLRKMWLSPCGFF